MAIEPLLSRSRTTPLLAAIAAVGLALRLGGLGQESLWADEFYTLTNVRAASLARMFEQLRDQANQPPYFVLLYGFVRMAGFGPVALRLPSALFGAAAPLLMYWLARRLFPRRPGVALTAAFLMAISPMNVWYSQEARPYAMQVTLELLTLALLAEGWRAAQAGRPRRGTLTLAASALLAGLTLEVHHFSIFPWAVCLGTLLTGGVRRDLAPRQWLPAAILLIAGTAHPAFGIIDRLGTRQHLGWLPDHYDASVWQDVFMAQWLGPFWNPFSTGEFRIGLAAGLTLTLLAGVRLASHKARADALPGLVIGLGIAVTLIAPVLISFIKPIIFYGQRYLIVALPFTILALALGAASGSRRARPLRALLAFGLLFFQSAYLWSYYEYRQKHPWDTAARYLTEHARPADAVVVMPDRMAGLLAYYLDAGWNVTGTDGDGARIRELLTREERPLNLVTYTDPRAWLKRLGAPEPEERPVVLETHQPGQTLWITRLRPTGTRPEKEIDRHAEQ